MHRHTCELPRCGDQQLAPLEACDGDLTAGGEDVGPWSCGDDCQWRSPTVWIDEWGDEGAHDDAVLQLDAASDGTFRALGWHDGDGGTQWQLRMLDEGGARVWSQALGVAACENHLPWLGVSGDLAAVVTFSCAGQTTNIEAFDASGESVWSLARSVPELAGAGLWGSQMGFAVYSGSLAEDTVSLTLEFIDPDGERSWEVEIDEPVWATAADETTLYGAGSQTVWSRRLSDGALLQSAPLRSSSVAATLDGSGQLILARQPANFMEPFMLQAFDSAFDAAWSVDLGDPPDNYRRRFGLDAGDGRIVLGLEQRDPELGSFDTHAGVLVFDESGEQQGALALQGPGHSRDFALDVATTPDGHIVAAGALCRAGSGLDGFVARLDEDVAGEPPSAVPIPTPQRPPAELDRPLESVPRTVFIDTSGPVLQTGTDPSLAEVPCVDGAFGFPALGWDPADVERAIAAAEAMLQPFAVRFVSVPPPSYLPYTRVLVGGDPESLGSADGHRGLACVIDCGDETWAESLFVFGEAASGPEELAQTIVHELGHAIGLDHIEVAGDLMYPTSSAQNTSIEDACLPLADNECSAAHESHCGVDQQNSHAELLAALGPASEELDPPSVVIEAPSSVVPRAVVPVGVEVTDATPGFGWRLSVPELGWRSIGSTAQDGAFELYLPPGEWTLEVEAMDQLGNSATESITIAVEP